MNILTGSRQRQKGMSMTAILILVAVFGTLIVTFFKVFPFYYNNFKVKSVLQALSEDTRIDPKSRRAIWESMQKRLFIDEVRSITRENVTMERKDGVTTITVTYEEVDNYIGNLFIGARFVETAVINR